MTNVLHEELLRILGDFISAAEISQKSESKRFSVTTAIF
jgi:hypothetical protein